MASQSGLKNSSLSFKAQQAPKVGNAAKPDIQTLIAQGDVDFAHWRKRKIAREEAKRATQASNMNISEASNRKAKRSFKKKKFDYVDPVEDMNRAVKATPMVNVHQMKFHEMKVERDPFVNAEQYARQSQIAQI